MAIDITNSRHLFMESVWKSGETLMRVNSYFWQIFF